MSYCRWSSDDFQCDVYCYESDHGWVLHVASGRHKPCEPMPHVIDYEALDEKDRVTAFIERHMKVMDIIDRSEVVPIGLSSDGESFDFYCPGECADKLEELRREGYNVPQGAIDALREEKENTNDNQ